MHTSSFPQVKWDTPASSTLDGRVINQYIIEVFTLSTSGATRIISADYPPNPDGNGRNR
jgi:hypothetical protein